MCRRRGAGFPARIGVRNPFFCRFAYLKLPNEEIELDGCWCITRFKHDFNSGERDDKYW